MAIYNVQLLINVPVWASSPAEALKVAMSDEVVYSETQQVREGDSNIGHLEPVLLKSEEDAVKLWPDQEVKPWGRDDDASVHELMRQQGA